MRKRTELEIMIAVANHPKVQAYRKAVQIMHSRMTALYGPDYAIVQDPKDNYDYVEGLYMTPQHQNLFASLMRGAAKVRRDVRNSLLAH
jgi:hypothetical protein